MSIGVEQLPNRIETWRGINQVMTTGNAVELAAALTDRLYIQEASFVVTAAGTNAASAVSVKLGIVGDAVEFSATCNLPASPPAGAIYPMILGADRFLEVGEVMLSTTVTLTSGPTGFMQVRLGVANQT